MQSHRIKTKLKNAIRIDRALKFVWKASRLYSVFSGGVVVTLGILPLISLYLLKLIIDSIASLEFTKETTLLSQAFSLPLAYIAAALSVGLLTAFFNNLSDYLKKAQSMTVSDYMFSILHEKAVQCDLAFYESPQYRDTLFRAQTEGPYRPTSIVSGLFAVCQSGASFIAVIWLLFMFNPVLPLVMIIAAMPGVFIRLKYSSRIYTWQEKRTEDERRAHYFHWMLTGDDHAKEFKLFNLGRYFMDRFKRIRSQLKSEKLWFERRRAAGDFIAQASALVCVFSSFVYIALKTVQAEISLGDMVLYFQAFQRGVGYLRTLLESGAQMYEDNLFLAQFYDFLKFKPGVIGPQVPVSIPEKIEAGIKFNNVEFFYHNYEKKVLKSVNFSIRPGEIVALVGRNGSGKSTIVKLFTRLYDPTGGGVYLDRINIKEFDPDLYRKKISVVFQDHMKYHLPAGENIQLGDTGRIASENDVILSAQNAGIHEKITKLPKKYETILGRWFKSGEELSQGQWQMLAIARAFYRDSEIVILDEPSSALDPKAEMALFKTLRTLMENRMVLIISHRYSSVRLADRILVMDEGRIVEQGNHSQLMELNGKYCQLYTAQAKGYT